MMMMCRSHHLISQKHQRHKTARLRMKSKYRPLKRWDRTTDFHSHSKTTMLREKQQAYEVYLHLDGLIENTFVIFNYCRRLCC